MGAGHPATLPCVAIWYTFYALKEEQSDKPTMSKTRLQITRCKFFLRSQRDHSPTYQQASVDAHTARAHSVSSTQSPQPPSMIRVYIL